MELFYVFVIVAIMAVSRYLEQIMDEKKSKRILELTERAAEIKLENLQRENNRIQADIEIILNPEGMYTTAESHAMEIYWKEAIRNRKAFRQSLIETLNEKYDRKNYLPKTEQRIADYPSQAGEKTTVKHTGDKM